MRRRWCWIAISTSRGRRYRRRVRATTRGVRRPAEDCGAAAWRRAASRPMCRRAACDDAGHAAAASARTAMLQAIGAWGAGCGSAPTPPRDRGRRGATGSRRSCPAWRTATPLAAIAAGAPFAALGAGAIYMTLTHNGHNAFADSSNPRSDLGDESDRAWRAVGARPRGDRRDEPARHGGGHRPRLEGDDAAGGRGLAHAGGLHAFLHPRAVRQSAQPRRRAARRAARRRRRGADHGGAAFPARRRRSRAT